MERVLNAAESARVSAAMLGFNREVNASIVDPAFIASVRKQLALDRRKAAEIFGGGINAFSRYENGKTKPRHWRWSSCSSCWTVILSCLMKSDPHSSRQHARPR